MHFYYLDESGDTGKNLLDPNQPIFVLGGISLRDEGWNTTHYQYLKLVETFLGTVPADFELHSFDLLNPVGSGPFASKSAVDRYQFAKDVLNLVVQRKHNVHWIAFDKLQVNASVCGLSLAYSPKHPYPLGFDYMVGYVNDHVKRKLGSTARALIIADEKQQYRKQVEQITHARRFGGAAAHRVKWIAEISYAVDSKKNAMIQISDLCVFCIRRFLEIEHGHHPSWPSTAGKFYAECFKVIDSRVVTKGLVEHPSPKMAKLNAYVAACRLQPKPNWKKRYGV